MCEVIKKCSHCGSAASKLIRGITVATAHQAISEVGLLWQEDTTSRLQRSIHMESFHNWIEQLFAELCGECGTVTRFYVKDGTHWKSQ